MSRGSRCARRPGPRQGHRDDPQRQFGHQAQQPQSPGPVLDGLTFGEHQFDQRGVGRMGWLGRAAPSVQHPGGDGHPFEHQLVERARRTRALEPHPPAGSGVGVAEEGAAGHPFGLARERGSPGPNRTLRPPVRSSPAAHCARPAVDRTSDTASEPALISASKWAITRTAVAASASSADKRSNKPFTAAV